MTIESEPFWEARKGGTFEPLSLGLSLMCNWQDMIWEPAPCVLCSHRHAPAFVRVRPNPLFAARFPRVDYSIRDATRPRLQFTRRTSQNSDQQTLTWWQRYRTVTTTAAMLFVSVCLCSPARWSRLCQFVPSGVSVNKATRDKGSIAGPETRQ